VAIGDNITETAGIRGWRKLAPVADPTKGAFFWLSAFFVVYCARPEDWIPGLGYLPCARITAILAMWGLFTVLGRTKRTFKDVPREGKLLLILIGLFFVSAVLSPIWIGGAISHTIDFFKVYLVWILAFLLITNFNRLRRIIYIQTVSVMLICVVSMIKGHDQPRLEGVLGGIYSNSNDLAFAIVLTLPFALAFLLTSRNVFTKVLWALGMLTMMAALFLTASRAGFIDLVIAGTVTLWHFGIKGKRPWLIAGVVLSGVLLMAVAGGKLQARFEALSGNDTGNESAYASYQLRMYAMERALDGMEHYPVFGLGTLCFGPYGGWHEVHMTYLQIGVEGGIPALIVFLMFFRCGFKNLRIMRKAKNLDQHTVLFVGALHASLIGFAVGASFAPEAYQFFPFFAVAFTSTLLQTLKERDVELGEVSTAPSKSRHFLEVYADHRTNGAVTPIR